MQFIKISMFFSSIRNKYTHFVTALEQIVTVNSILYQIIPAGRMDFPVVNQ